MRIALFISTLIFLAPLPASAVGGLIGCGAGGAAGGAVASQLSAHAGLTVPVSDAVVRTSTTQSAVKECILDGLVPALREALIATITDSIVSWINSGFEGAPAFVTDLDAFLGQIADNTALDFIEGTELGFLCSPFKLEVKLALATNYQARFRDRISCSLSDVTGNIEGFFAGNFSQGGWPAWFSIATNMQNNPYGAYLLASAELDARIVSAQGRELKLLDFGAGFFSKKKCVLYADNVDATGSRICLKEEIVTPGAQINEQLARVLGSGFTQLELADEIDEIISALLSQLSQQLFTSLDGLRGLSSNSSSSAFNGGSYLQNLVDQSQGGSIQQAQQVLSQDINGAIQLEEVYQTVLGEIISGYENAKIGFEGVFQCSQTANLTAQATSASTTVAVGIIPIVTDYKNDNTASQETVARLIAVRALVEGATTVEGINAAASAYESLLASGVVHTNADIAALLLERDAQATTFAGYDSEIQAGFALCGTTPPL